MDKEKGEKGEKAAVFYTSTGNEYTRDEPARHRYQGKKGDEKVMSWDAQDVLEQSKRQKRSKTIFLVFITLIILLVIGGMAAFFALRAKDDDGKVERAKSVGVKVNPQSQGDSPKPQEPLDSEENRQPPPVDTMTEVPPVEGGVEGSNFEEGDVEEGDVEEEINHQNEFSDDGSQNPAQSGTQEFQVPEPSSGANEPDISDEIAKSIPESAFPGLDMSIFDVPKSSDRIKELIKLVETKGLDEIEAYLEVNPDVGFDEGMEWVLAKAAMYGDDELIEYLYEYAGSMQSYHTAVMAAYLYGHTDVCNMILDLELKLPIPDSQLLISKFRSSDNEAVADFFVNFVKEVLVGRIQGPDRFLLNCHNKGKLIFKKLIRANVFELNDKQMAWLLNEVVGTKDAYLIQYLTQKPDFNPLSYGEKAISAIKRAVSLTIGTDVESKKQCKERIATFSPLFASPGVSDKIISGELFDERINQDYKEILLGSFPKQ